MSLMVYFWDKICANWGIWLMIYVRYVFGYAVSRYLVLWVLRYVIIVVCGGHWYMGSEVCEYCGTSVLSGVSTVVRGYWTKWVLRRIWSLLIKAAILRYLKLNDNCYWTNISLSCIDLYSFILLFSLAKTLMNNYAHSHFYLSKFKSNCLKRSTQLRQLFNKGPFDSCYPGGGISLG